MPRSWIAAPADAYSGLVTSPWSLLLKKWKLEALVYWWSFILWVISLTTDKKSTGFITSPMFALLLDCRSRRRLLRFFHLPSSLTPKILKGTGGGSILVEFKFVSDIINCCQNANAVYHLTFICPVFGLLLPPPPTLILPHIHWSLLLENRNNWRW